MTQTCLQLSLSLCLALHRPAAQLTRREALAANWRCIRPTSARETGRRVAGGGTFRHVPLQSAPLGGALEGVDVLRIVGGYDVAAHVVEVPPGDDDVEEQARLEDFHGHTERRAVHPFALTTRCQRWCIFS